MKTFRLTFLILLLFTFRGFAQTTISGTVKNSHGDFLHNAFVQDKEYRTGVYTDSIGNFSLPTHANPRLLVSCPGYRDTVVKPNGQGMLVIVLRQAVYINGKPTDDNSNAASTSTTDLLRTTLSDQINTTSSNTRTSFTRGAELTEIHQKEATKGSRFLFPYWSHGYVVNAKDSIIQNASILFNYDKIGGSLLYTQDSKTVLSVDMDEVRSFTIFDNIGQRHTFAPVPQIDKTHYLQVIAAGPSYRIYKLIKTTFTAANFNSDGVFSEGNRYDEYADESTYFVLDVKANHIEKITLRKKALKDAFPNDVDKLNKFMKDNDSDVDDNYLAGLGDYMNQ